MRHKKKRVIRIIGATQHNLKNISVEIPKEKLTVITGPSGSGKSSLALDVLYTEGKRRYIESLSTYARQFLGIPKKPRVESIEGISPAIAIEQKTVGNNPRSTVGTITEITDYLRVLFTRVGRVICPSCSSPVQPASIDSLVATTLAEHHGESIQILAPIVTEQKGTFVHELEQLVQKGFYRFVIDKKQFTFRSLSEIFKLKLLKTHRHSISVLIDMFVVEPEEEPRIRDDISRAFDLASGFCTIESSSSRKTWTKELMCAPCRKNFTPAEPRLFSFNSPVGACPTCSGLGTLRIYGYMNETVTTVCSDCEGRRLNAQALAVHVGDRTFYDVGEMSIRHAISWLSTLSLSTTELTLVEPLISEIKSRLQFLIDVGIGYLTLNRTARTLSGGESQRIRLGTQIGSALSGVLYVLDEPSIGLHPRDHDQLIGTLKKLCALSNTVVVVEHDRETILNADHVIDMGPGAGIHGGEIVAQGTPADILKAPESITGAYLSGRSNIKRTAPLRKPQGFVTVKNCTRNNLKGIDISIPLGVFTAICGVSGSGKSTFGLGELPHAFHRFSKTGDDDAFKIAHLEGGEQIRDVVIVDQSPIGRTSRSTPATYVGIFNTIRTLFASLPEANARGYTISHFSFNVAKGHCAECKGEGQVTVSMYYLPDVVNQCHVCHGARYASEILGVTYKGKSIADVLAMDAREATDFFSAHTALQKRLKLLCDVGLDYLTLGQPSPTLSGGEAQRLKLVTELAKRGNETLYILDEPTTGLGASDVAKLISVLNRLIKQGNSVIVIEHNQYILENADYIIELGPEGGDEGGYLVATGTPVDIAANPKSPTGRYLKQWAAD